MKPSSAIQGDPPSCPLRGSLEQLEDYLVYVDTFAKVHEVLGRHTHQEIRVSYSGGSDSDTVAWVLRYLGYNIKMVTYDTGLEYEATWRHIDYMRSQGFDIEISKADKSIPWTIKKYGTPFVSKHVSDMLQRLQSHNFKFKEHGSLDFDALNQMYPNSRSALKWWTNTNNTISNNISWNTGLKEFLILNDGVPFKPSAHCCYYSKKLPSVQYARKNDVALLMLGIRRAEGGKRATAYPSCYIPTSRIHPYAMYLPLFWWTNEDKDRFDRIMNIKHSDCYDVYGMRRTGCPGCPFGRQFEEEVLAISEHEPRLEKAVENLFGKSYEYSRAYRDYQKSHKLPRKKNKAKPDSDE